MSAHAGVTLKKTSTIKQITFSIINNECGHRDYGFFYNAPPLDFQTSKKKKQKIFKTYTNASGGAKKTCDRDKYINYFSIRKYN